MYPQYGLCEIVKKYVKIKISIKFCCIKFFHNTLQLHRTATTQNDCSTQFLCFHKKPS